MGKYLSTFDTLADYEAATSELGYPNVSLIKADGSIIYAKNAPISSICYEIIPESIESYTATTYDSVYSFSDAKWYMLNNLNEYEQYGVYDIVEDISNATTYEGKLAVVDTTEYQYSGGSWNEVGTYEDVSVTYEIDYTQPSPYVGQELSTTFKIPYADVEAVGSFELLIANNNRDELDIHLEARGGNYRYQGYDDYYQGTVTNDGEYFYLSLPSDAPQSIMIDSVGYWNSTPIHLIVGSKQASVEYAEKEAPSYSIYNTVQEMEAVGCPNVGVNEYAFVGNDLYKYFANEEWSEVTYYEPKMVAFQEDGDPLLVYGSGELTKNEVGLSFTTAFTTVYIGDSVTSIAPWAVEWVKGLTSVAIGSGVTSIGDSAFQACTKLTSVTVNATTPPTLGSDVFFSTHSSLVIYVPSESVNTYKTAWNKYASRIQAIP